MNVLDAFVLLSGLAMDIVIIVAESANSFQFTRLLRFQRLMRLIRLANMLRKLLEEKRDSVTAGDNTVLTFSNLPTCNWREQNESSPWRTWGPTRKSPGVLVLSSTSLRRGAPSVVHSGSAGRARALEASASKGR